MAALGWLKLRRVSTLWEPDECPVTSLHAVVSDCQLSGLHSFQRAIAEHVLQFAGLVVLAKESTADFFFGF